MPLSQKQFSDFKKVCEQFNQVEEVIEEELVHEICDELIEELIEEGYSEEEAIEIVDEATDLYIDETLCEVSDSYYDSAVRASKKAAQGIDKAARQKRRAGQVRYAKRKAGDALKGAVGAAKGALSKVKSKAAGAAVDVAMAGSMAKKKVGEVKQAAKEAPGKAKAAASDAKKKAKSGIKGFIKRQAEKVVKRMSEENVKNEGYQPMTPDRTARVDRAKKKAYDADHRAQSKNDSAEADKQFKRRMAMDSRTKMRKEELDIFDIILEFLQVEGYAETLEEAEWMMANLIDEEAIDIILGEEFVDEALTGERLSRAETKMKSLGRKKSTLASREALSRVSIGKEGTGVQGGKKAPVKRGGGGTAGRTKVSGTGGDDMDRGYGNKAARRAAALKKEEFEAWLDEAMSSYDRNRKRAAQRAAARNAARAAGKTGVVPGVGYVSPR